MIRLGQHEYAKILDRCSQSLGEPPTEGYYCKIGGKPCGSGVTLVSQA